MNVVIGWCQVWTVYNTGTCMNVVIGWCLVCTVYNTGTCMNVVIGWCQVWTTSSPTLQTNLMICSMSSTLLWTRETSLRSCLTMLRTLSWGLLGWLDVQLVLWPISPTQRQVGGDWFCMGGCGYGSVLPLPLPHSLPYRVSGYHLFHQGCKVREVLRCFQYSSHHFWRCTRISTR